MTKLIDEYKSPQHKVLAMLHLGREKLRVEYKTVREELRASENQVRAVEASRETWRARAKVAEEELRRFEKKS